MSFLLDTDHLSLIRRPTGREYVTVVANVNLRGGTTHACVVNFHEQSVGCHDQINSARTPADGVRAYDLLQRVIRSYTAFPILPFDDAAAAKLVELRAAKVRVGTSDLRVACIALVRDLTVVTRNARDFGRVPGLRTADGSR